MPNQLALGMLELVTPGSTFMRLNIFVIFRELFFEESEEQVSCRTKKENVNYFRFHAVGDRK